MKVKLMIPSKINIPSTPSDKSAWHVVPNPDQPNVLSICKTGRCSVTYAVKHKDGGIIRFYQGRAMNRHTAEKLKLELELMEN